MVILALPARVPSSRWWLDGRDGPAMTRLLNELRCQGPSLWRVPLRATGCQNASEMDRRNLDYDSVKTACKRILAAEKLQDATIGNLEKCPHIIGLVLPARCGQVVKIEQLPLPLVLAA